MLHFNWEKIKLFCNYDCSLILNILNCLNKGKVPTKKEISVLNKLKGHDRNSFIENLTDLLLDDRSTKEQKCEYLEIASQRNHIDYILHNIDYLPIYYIEDNYDINKLKRNNLLQITEINIIFKY